MENEELHWKMRQSLDHSGMMSMSVIEGDFKIYDLLGIVLSHDKSFSLLNLMYALSVLFSNKSLCSTYKQG